MKYLDKVKLVNNRKEYNENNVYAGEIGTIFEAEIRDNSFFVIFDNYSDSKWYKDCIIKIEDLQFVEDGNVKDEEILEALPKQNPKWWCKVEDGHIINLLGEKKNKIPYDYKS